MVVQIRTATPDGERVEKVMWEPFNTCLTSVKIIKNEVGCRDDTMPKTVKRTLSIMDTKHLS